MGDAPDKPAHDEASAREMKRLRNRGALATIRA
jgi:hypothetical protein